MGWGGRAHVEDRPSHASCVCSVKIDCNHPDSAGVWRTVPGVSYFPVLCVPTEGSTAVQGNGVCFLQFQKSVWKVNRIRWVCTLKNISCFLHRLDWWCRDGPSGCGGSVRLVGPGADCRGRDLQTGFEVAFIDETRLLKYFRSLT